VARWRHLSYRRVRVWPSASLKLGVAYCRGLAFGGRLLVKTFLLQLYGPVEDLRVWAKSLVRPFS